MEETYPKRREVDSWKMEDPKLWKPEMIPEPCQEALEHRNKRRRRSGLQYQGDHRSVRL